MSIPDADVAASSTFTNPFELLNCLTTTYDRSDLFRRQQAGITLGLLHFDTALHQLVAMGGVPGDWLVLQLGKLLHCILSFH